MIMTVNPEIVVEKGYEKIANSYHEKRLKSNRSIDLLKKSIKKMPKNGKVLDVGCGGGYPVAKFFSGLGYHVTGIDVSEKMIEIAKKTVPNGLFYKKSMIEMDFPDESFDIVVSFFAIIHVPRKYHEKIISKFYEMLKPGGVILICMGIDDSEKYVNSNWLGTEMYWSHFDKEKNLKMIRNTGFEIIWDEDLGPEDDRHTWILARK